MGYLSSTEMFSEEKGDFVRGPELPISVYAHCIGNINATHAILAGGYSEQGYENRTFLLDKRSGTWSDLPALVRFHFENCGKWLIP